MLDLKSHSYWTCDISTFVFKKTDLLNSPQAVSSDVCSSISWETL